MKIALDPYMIRHIPLVELPGVVADHGYEWIELSPREDFLPFFRYPRVDLATVRRFRKELHAAGVTVSTVLPLYHWAGPDEDARQAAVRNWKRAIQITAELGVGRMVSEFNGRPEAVAASENKFFASLEELLPIFEREGIDLALEPHPDDFIEDGIEAINVIRGLDHPRLSYLYCAPHTYHIGNDPAGIIGHAGDLLTDVHLADSLNFRASSGLRYIINPPGSTARIHQHLDIGQGEVDFPRLFSLLAQHNFDGQLTVCVFAWEERAAESNRFNLARTKELWANVTA